MKQSPKSGSEAKGRLDRAIAAARRPATAERLSSAVRDGLIDDIRSANRELRPMAPLFRPFSRSLAAVTAPVLIVGLVLVAAVQYRGHVGAADAAQPVTQIEVSKVGDRVVFSIPNGGKEHTVSRSSDPRHFGVEGSVKVADSYVDRLDSGSNVVFYRIN